MALGKAAGLLSGSGSRRESSWYSAKRRLLGPPMVNEALGEQRLSNVLALGVLAPDEPIVKTADFTVDLAAKRVTRADGSGVRLTPTEWQLLEILVRNRGRLVAQRQLLQEVWGPAYETESNYLRVYVAQLRHKLEPEPSRPRYLLTESGMGYRFAA